MSFVFLSATHRLAAHPSLAFEKAMFPRTHGLKLGLMQFGCPRLPESPFNMQVVILQRRMDWVQYV